MLRAFSYLTLGLTLFLGLRASAQDVEQLSKVHLANNNFYTGVVLEIVDSEYVDIVSLGGMEIRFSFEEVLKIESIEGVPSAAIYRYFAQKSKKKKQKLRAERKKYFVNGTRHRGYFGLVQYVTGYAHMGVTSVHGYKVNQYTHLGLGFGFDGVQRPMSFKPYRFSEKHGNAFGMHFPVFVYLGGEVLKTRTTPYYAIELGYAYVIPMESLLDLETREIQPHGASAAIAFGVKFSSHRTYHTNVGLKATYRGRNMTFRELQVDPESSLYYLEFNNVWTSGWFLGLTIVQGF